MKNFQKTTLLLSLLIFISSCEKKQTELEFEKSVMTEIFPSLIDSICFDTRKMTPRPLFYVNYYDSAGNYVRTDWAKSTSKQRIEYQKWSRRRNEISNDTSAIIIAFDPFIKRDSILQGMLKIYYPKSTVVKSEDESNEIRFIFETIELNNKFKIKNISEFPSTNIDSLFVRKYDFVFSGALKVTRIQFDKFKNIGILAAGFTDGSISGDNFGYVLIEKVDGKWKINRIETTETP
jgi:hypothetical protein